MRTVKWNPFLSGVAMLLGGVLLWAGAAHADISSTNSAAIVVFPKIVVDTTHGTDTLIELTNTNTDPNSLPVKVRCFYVDANGHCANTLTICDPGVGLAPAGTSPESVLNETCVYPDYCVPGWKETDFLITLTVGQPLVWTVSQGLAGVDLPLASTPGIGGQLNEGSIPPALEDPMIGELKCVEVGPYPSETPIDLNDLKGEATIEIFDPTLPQVDIEGYNAIGIQAIPGQCNGDASISCTADNQCQPPATASDVSPCMHANNFDNTLVIGGPAAEYNGCPNYLILDHYFDDAPDGAVMGDGSPLDSTVRTWLTLVPCSEDFLHQTCATTTVQYLVYNEFEQRLSTSRPLTCFSELQLSDIDTRIGDEPPNNSDSIFNVNVQGTVTGQTIIRGVTHALLGVVHEFHKLVDSNGAVYSAAYMLDQSPHVRQGPGTQPEIIQLSEPQLQ